MKFIMGELLKVEYTLTENLSDFSNSDQAQINYSLNKELSGFHIAPHGLLSEIGIKHREIKVETGREFPFFFTTDGNDLNFDIFSAAFFLISRYEEYGEYEKDKYGRFMSSNSLAFKNDFLQLPLINIWAENLRHRLLNKFPDLKHRKIPASYALTIDIDNPWAHLNKAFWRLAGGMLKNFIKGRWSEVNERISVCMGREKDAFDTYDFIKKHHVDSTKIFVLAGDKGKYDNKVKINNKNWRKLIKDLSLQYSLGLHPSFRSNNSFSELKEEKKNLEEITGQSTTLSRQHFLRMEFPVTYEKLIQIGINQDFSMGYADQPGFRAGTSTPFKFYNIEKETECDLLITPFCVMDRTLKDYMNLDTDAALQVVNGLAEEIKKYGGIFVSIWHNESFSGSGEWKGWDQFYLSMIKELNNTFAL
ncbi:MAG: polysaccharide deacetylase family protein [Bacteroidales bacterium]|nr:polysaccharide deacetylase family protein [Bacteroidales bacterium]MCF8390856.1 polysaccharide deacetylase family protein [Bacteroidales bacterium]